MSRSFAPTGAGPHVLVVHGPNLGALGRREPAVYGDENLDAVMSRLGALAAELGITVSGLQSDDEGELLGVLLGAADRGIAAVVLNPGAFAHTSYALRDAVAASGLPVVEVHLSNVHARERWRSRLVIAPVAAGLISGLGVPGYELGLRAAAELAGAGRIRQSP